MSRESDDIRVLFALGGETLAFYELRTLSEILRKFGDYPAFTEEELRSELESVSDVTTANGNYFTCNAADLWRSGMEFMARQVNAVELTRQIDRALPYVSKDGTCNCGRLERNLRNTLFAGSFKEHRFYLERPSVEEIDTRLCEQAYLPLTDARYAGWLSSLSGELLSVIIWKLTTYIEQTLPEISTLYDIAVRRFDDLANPAKLMLIDLMILKGDWELADKSLTRFSNVGRDGVLPRTAWLNFLRGENGVSMRLYAEALDGQRSYGQSEYFTTLTGVFYILSLLKNVSDPTLGMGLARVQAGLGMQTPFWHRSYRAFLAYISSRFVLPEAEAEMASTEECSEGLEVLFISLAEYWQGGGKLRHERLTQLRQLMKQCNDNHYGWLAQEADEIIARCTQATWQFPTEQSRYLIDCVRILPPWSMDLERVDDILNRQENGLPQRAIWVVGFSAECPTNVRLEVLEQHLTKTGRWSKGHRQLLMKVVREAWSTGVWPSYFTVHDIRAAEVIGRLEGGRMLEDGESANSHVSHNDALLGLIDYQNLYWADGIDETPVKVIVDEPYVKISQEGESAYRLALYPNVDDGAYLSAVRFDDGSLHLFCFRQIHRSLADVLGQGGILIPSVGMGQLNDLCVRLAGGIRIRSEHELTSMPVNETVTEPVRMVICLERRERGLDVELTCQPFGDSAEVVHPDEGLRTTLECRDGKLVRHLRDCETELRKTEEILSVCTALDGEVQVSPYHWFLEDGDSVYQFLLQLQELNGQCEIRWKTNRKVSMSRRISFSNVTMRTKATTNWLELDGEVQVDDDLKVSFQKLLELSRKQNGKFIVLDDGKIIALADEFRRSLDTINTMGQVSRKGQMQFNSMLLPVLNEMLADYQQVERTQEWLEQAKRIDEAMHLEPKLPKGLAKGVKLRDYQVEGYRWMFRLDHWGAGACLADDMGLGKTVQTIAFLLAKAAEGPMLVVAPTSVCANWLDELAKFAPSLEGILFGSGDRKAMLERMKAGQVLVVSYGLLQSEIESFEQVEWRVVVLDEAQAIKNWQAKRSRAVLQLNAKFRMATTGTPIENNLGELWSLFQFITPWLLGGRTDFQRRFCSGESKTSDTLALTCLNALIRPFVLRRCKDEVLKELPSKTEVSVRVELSPGERAFYEAVRQQQLAELDDAGVESNANGNRVRILAAITKLRQAACNPLLIDPGTKVPSAKLDAFCELVEGLVSSGHRTLVFSQFVRHLDIIRRSLEGMHLSYEYLDGSTPQPEREAAVKRFQEGGAELFLISLKAGGLGLNLTRADYVIMLDPWWNPAVEQQAADRAHRLGQTRPVTIYRLIAKDTIEEKIIELHRHKQDLVLQLLADSDGGKAISSQELYKLLQDPTSGMENTDK